MSFYLKMDVFANEMMANMWEEAYINANPKSFDSYKFRVAALMRHVEHLVGEVNFKNAVQVILDFFIMKKIKLK